MKFNFQKVGEAVAREYADSIFEQTKDNILNDLSLNQLGIVHELIAQAYADGVDESPVVQSVITEHSHIPVAFCRPVSNTNPFNEQG